MSKKKISIRLRILLSVLCLISFILLLIIAVFNRLVSQYIKGNVNEQLRVVKEWAYQNGQLEENWLFPPAPQPPDEKNQTASEDRKKIPRGQFGKPEILIVNENGEMLFPDENRVFAREYSDLLDITVQLKKQSVNLNSDEIMRLNASGRDYYFVSLKIAKRANQSQTFLLYCIDMTSIADFSHRINIVLLMVLLLALLLSVCLAFLLSVIITRPIKELTAFADRIGHGNFQTSQADYKDIELSTLSDSMNKAAIQLERFDREQKIFFQNVSHELRTPLQSIKSNAEAIEYSIMDSDQASRIIISETDRLSEMVEVLLYFSYLDNAIVPMQMECHDIREILSGCVERQRAYADKMGVEFEFSFEKKPVMMICDEKRISRAFSNVLSNAIRYARKTIQIVCRYSDHQVEVAIVDDGEGMAQEELPKIFDRFYKGRDGNHGIGLSIVKTVVEQHHGSIKVSSTTEGSRFDFAFPVE